MPCCAQKKCEECLLHFQMQLQHERMTIQYVEPQDPRALLELHGQELSDSLSHSMEFSNTFLFRMIFFFKWSDPKASFCFVYENWNLNVATICAHLLHPYEDSYYPNYAMVKVPSNLCHVKRGCACNLQHTQLFEYEGSSLFKLYCHNRRGWVGFSP